MRPINRAPPKYTGHPQDDAPELAQVDAARLPRERDDQREQDDPHHIVDDRCTENRGPLAGAERVQFHQRLRRDADAGCGENRADENAGPDQRLAEGCRDKGAGEEREHDTTKRRPERHGTHPPHLHEIGLETRDEHQQNDADVGEILDGSEQGRRRRPVHDRVHGREDGPAEDVEKRRTQNQSGEDLAEDRRLPDAVRRRRGEFRGGDECGQQQQELEQMRHIGSEGVACIVPEPCRQPNW